MATAAIATARVVNVDAVDVKSAKMVLTTEDGEKSLTVRYAPKAVTYSNLARTWAEIARPGREPILSAADKPLKKLAYDLTLASVNPDVTMEGDIRALEAMALGDQRIAVQFGPAEAGLYRITALSVTSVDRHHISQRITQAVVSVELTKASDFKPAVGPITGGHDTGGAKFYGGVTYRVRKGDTLGRISNRFYKTPRRWRLIADANKIRRPKSSTKLKVGKKIKIPKVKR